jgi:hypothetical protein
MQGFFVFGSRSPNLGTLSRVCLVPEDPGLTGGPVRSRRLATMCYSVAVSFTSDPMPAASGLDVSLTQSRSKDQAMGRLGRFPSAARWIAQRSTIDAAAPIPIAQGQSTSPRKWTGIATTAMSATTSM